MEGATRERRTSRRMILVVLAVATLMVLVVPQSASAGKPSYNCPPGFDLGGLTADQALQLPNIQAGLAAGVYDEAFVRAFQVATDRNGDGVICFQSFPSNANDASLLQYFYNVVENNASVRTG